MVELQYINFGVAENSAVANKIALTAIFETVNFFKGKSNTTTELPCYFH